MSVWILHTVAEAMPGMETRLPLPLATAEDFTNASSVVEMKRRLRAVMPDAPPETLTREADRIWKYTHQLQVEDILVMPLKASREVVFAQITGLPAYENGGYVVPVRWFEPRAGFKRFGRGAALLEDDVVKLREVSDTALRNQVRTILKMKGTRFARWKWLLGIFMALGLLRTAHQLLSP